MILTPIRQFDYTHVPLADGLYVLTVTQDGRDGYPAETSPAYFLRVDTAPPTGRIFINNNDATCDLTDVTLSITVDPDQGSTVREMQLTNDLGLWGAWQQLAAELAWQLTDGLGQKTIYVRFRDLAGNISEIYSDSIQYRGLTSLTLQVTINGYS